MLPLSLPLTITIPFPRLASRWDTAGAGRGFCAWFWQRTSLPSLQQIGGFDLSAPLDVFRKLTAFPRSHNCFYHTTPFWTAWPFTSWHHLYLQANLCFGSHHIILPILPQDLLRLREWHHCDLTGVIMGKQFFLDASKWEGDVMPSLFNPWHSCSVADSFILADIEVTALPGFRENNLRRSRHLWNPQTHPFISCWVDFSFPHGEFFMWWDLQAPAPSPLCLIHFSKLLLSLEGSSWRD